MSDSYSPLSTPLGGVIRPAPAIPVRREQEGDRRRKPVTPRHPSRGTPPADGQVPHIDEYALGR